MTRASKSIIAMSVASTLFFGVLLLSLQPVPLPTSENTVRVEGLITAVEADDRTHDLIFEIEGDNDTYYVDKGLGMGLKREEMDKLLHKKISLYYVQTSSPIEALVGTHHISKIEVADQLLFDEMQIISSVDFPDH